MKKYLLLLIIFPSLLFAQATANLNLRFEAAVGDSCNLKIDNYYIDEYNPNLKAIIKDNQCSFKIVLEKSCIAKLTYNKQSVLLLIEPGDALDLNITKDSLYKAITYSGAGAEQNTFLNLFYQKFINDYDKDRVKQLILTSTVDAFEMRLFNEQKKQKEFYEKQDKSKFTKAFTLYMEQTIRYNYFASLISFPIINANQSTTILTVNALPGVMLEGISNKLINDGSLTCLEYRDFVTYSVIYMTSSNNGFNKFTDYNISMDKKIATAKANLKGATLVWYIASFLNADCDKVTPFTVKHVYADLNDLEKGGTYTRLLKTKCETRMKAKDVASKDDKNKDGISKAKSKNPFEGVVLTDVAGKPFNPKDIEGKVVFVDFWASWCGPCRVEFPASKVLHERFTPKQLKNIVFLYISIDADPTAWRNAVQSIGMNGLLLISPGNWSSPVVKHIGIPSIPRYMLIDKTGKIADPNAPRPSSGDEIYLAIMKLLEQ